MKEMYMYFFDLSRINGNFSSVLRIYNLVEKKYLDLINI